MLLRGTSQCWSSLDIGICPIWRCIGCYFSLLFPFVFFWWLCIFHDKSPGVSKGTFLTGESALQRILNVGTISSLLFAVRPLCLQASNHTHTSNPHVSSPLTSLSFRLEKALLFKGPVIAWDLSGTSRRLTLFSKQLISNLNYSCKVFLEIPRWDIRGEGHKDWNSADPSDILCEILNV